MVDDAPQESTVAEERTPTAYALRVLTDHGILYHDHVQREQRQPGGAPPKKVWMATEREFVEADLLSVRPSGGGLIVVTADGQKWGLTEGAPPVNLLEV